jgi:hypothetical protein
MCSGRGLNSRLHMFLRLCQLVAATAPSVEYGPRLLRSEKLGDLRRKGPRRVNGSGGSDVAATSPYLDPTPPRTYRWTTSTSGSDATITFTILKVEPPGQDGALVDLGRAAGPAEVCGEGGARRRVETE